MVLKIICISLFAPRIFYLCYAQNIYIKKTDYRTDISRELSIEWKIPLPSKIIEYNVKHQVHGSSCKYILHWILRCLSVNSPPITISPMLCQQFMLLAVSVSLCFRYNTICITEYVCYSRSFHYDNYNQLSGE